MRTNKENLRAWIGELRSGQWTQIKKYYSDGPNCYCALGVLLHVVIDRASDDSRYDESRRNFICAYTGLDLDAQKKIADMNDTGSSFAQIADYIEATYCAD